MPLYKKITISVVFALCGFLGGFISQAQAATFDSFTSTAVTDVSGGNDFRQALNGGASGLTGSASYVEYNLSDITGADLNNSLMRIYECAGSGLSLAGCTFSSADSFSTSGDYVTWTFNTPVSISSGNYYVLRLITNGSGFPRGGVGDNSLCSINGASSCDTGNASFDEMYYQVCDSGGCTGPTPPTTASTTIISIAPSGTIASSSPITITITGELGTDDLASTTAAGNTVRLLSWVGGVDTSFVSPSQTWTLSTDGSFMKTYQVTTDLPAGRFKIYASITSAGTYDCSAIDSGGVCVPIGGVNVATTTYFTLNSSYFEHITGTSTPTNLYTPQECGVSNLSGCFQNALAALFYPSSSPGDAVSSISEAARGKFPFVYVYQIGAIRTSLLSASSTAPTGLTVNLWKIPGQATSTIELISQTKVTAVPYSNTIYTVLTWLIWLLMAEYIYIRVIKMHDTHTPS